MYIGTGTIVLDHTNESYYVADDIYLLHKKLSGVSNWHISVSK